MRAECRLLLNKIIKMPIMDKLKRYGLGKYE